MVIKADKRELIAPQQFFTDNVIDIAGAEAVLSVCASAAVRSIEAMQGEARVNYRLTFKLIFKDGEGFSCREEGFDHTAVIRGAGITPSASLSLSAHVSGIEHSGLSPVRAKAAVDITGYVISPLSYECAEVNEGVHKRTETVTVERVFPIKNSEIIASGTFDFKESIDRILTADSHVLVKESDISTEIARLSGDCITYLTYLSGGVLNSRVLTTPFSTEVLAEGLCYDCVPRLRATPDNVITTLTDSGELRVETVISVGGYAVGRSDVEVVADVYSETHALLTERAAGYVSDNLCLTDITEKFSGSLRLDGEKKRIRSVLAVTAPSVGVVSVDNTSGLSAGGVITATVIYLDEDEAIESAAVEIPFTASAGGFACGSNLYAQATVTAISAKLRHNDQIELSGEVNIEIHGSTERAVSFVSAVEQAEELPENEAAITLHIVRAGQTLWDVAKALLSNPETITALNPNLKLPLMGGEKVVIYRKLS